MMMANCNHFGDGSNYNINHCTLCSENVFSCKVPRKINQTSSEIFRKYDQSNVSSKYPNTVCLVLNGSLLWFLARYFF